MMVHLILSREPKVLPGTPHRPIGFDGFRNLARRRKNRAALLELGEDVALSGLLADGTPFDFGNNSLPNRGIRSGATLTLPLWEFLNREVDSRW